MNRKVSYPHKKVRIAGQIWTLWVVPRGNPKLLKAWGVTHFEEREIYVANYLGQKTFKHTLVHELLHAYFYELGYHNTLLAKLKKEQNEWLVDTLAQELMPKFRSNIFSIKNFQIKKDPRS